MSDEIIGLPPWIETPPGRYLLDWERARFDAAVADLFGYHALQLGLPVLDGLAGNRIPHRWLAAGPADLATLDSSPASMGSVPPDSVPAARGPALVADTCALPFAAASLDLVLLPHALDLSADPHATLREVERVLVPEGRVIISGMNPMSLWGLKQQRGRFVARMGFEQRRYLPDAVHFIGYRRLRDWLRLLSFEVEAVQFGCFRPAVRSQPWLDRWAWMDRMGDRWWPIFGAAYFVVAVKRVHGMRLLEPARRTRVPIGAAAAAPVSVARNVDRVCARGLFDE